MKIVFESEEEKDKFIDIHCVGDIKQVYECYRKQLPNCEECFKENGVGIEVESVERTENEQK